MIRLSISEQGGVPRLVTFNQDQITVGRTPQCDLRLGGQGVSSSHCRLTRTPAGLQIEDLGSTNGTFVNRQKIAAPTPVAAADEIVVAMYRVQVIDDSMTSAPGVAPGSHSMFAPSADGSSGPTAHVPAQPAPIIPESGGHGMYRAAGTPSALPAQPSGALRSVPPAAAAPIESSAPQEAVDPENVAWAREWEKIDSLSRNWLLGGKDPKLLLKGARLKSAKAWLAGGRGKHPPPKREQRDFIFASSRRRQLKVFGNVTMLGLALGAAGVGGWYLINHWPPTLVEDDGPVAGDDGVAAAESGGEGDEGPVEKPRDFRKESDAVAAYAEAQDDPVLATRLALEALRLLPERPVIRGSKAEQVFRERLLGLRGRPLLGHEERINAVGFSTDGKWAITASEDQSARLWDLTGSASRTWIPLRGHGGGIKAMALSPKGKFLFTAGDGGGVYRWNLKHADPPSTGTQLKGLSSGATDAAVSGDGRWLVVGGRGGTARVWDATSDSPRSRRLSGHTAPIRAVAINHDGSRVFAASEDAFASMWRMDADGEPGRRTKYTGHLGAVLDIAVSPDGTKVLTGGDDGAKLWNPTRGGSGKDLVIEEKVSKVAISRDSQLGVLVSEDTLRIWEIKNPDKVGEIKFPGHKENVLALALDGPRGEDDKRPNLALSGSADGSARTWNLDSRATTVKTVELGPHADDVRAVAFSNDGYKVITGDASGEGRIWNHTVSGPAGASAVGALHRKAVTAVAINPSATRLVSTSADGLGIVWNLTKPGRLERLSTLKGHTGAVDAVAINVDGQFLATGDSGGQIRLWDLNRKNPGAASKVLKGHRSGIKAFAFTPDGKRLLSLSTDGVNVWRLSKDLKAEKLTHRDELVAMSLSPDGRWLMTASVKQLRLWDLNATPIRGSGKGLRNPHALDVITVAVGPEGKWAASSGKDASTVMWDLKAGKPKKIHLHSEPVDAIAFSRDGKWMVTGSQDKSIRLWDTTAKRPWTGQLPALTGHDARIQVLTFSDDSNWLLSASTDKTLRVWDLSSGDPEAIRKSAVILAGHTTVISGAAIAGQGQLAVSGSFDNTVRAWPLTPHALIPVGCLAAGRGLSETEWEEFFKDAPFKRACPD